MFGIKRQHALIAVLSLAAVGVIVREVYPAVVTSGTKGKTIQHFIIRNVTSFTQQVESSPGVPYVVPTKKRFIITDITVCNLGAQDTAFGMLEDITDNTSYIAGDLCIRAGENVHVNYTNGPRLLTGEQLFFTNSGGNNTPLSVFIAGYEEKG